MPRAYRDAIASQFNQVIVPSDFCEDGVTMGDGGLTMVRVVPHCFDPSFWRGQRLEVPDGRTRFYAIGAWGDRKNQLGVLKAYLGEFTSVDRVTLTMWMPEARFDDLNALLAATGIPSADLPALTIPDPRRIHLSEDELVAMHASHHCFVSATRGEGWGLGMFEAAIMGNAVIAPLCGGQGDFLCDYSAHRHVPHQLTPCFGSVEHEDIEGAYARATVSRPPGVDCHQKWAEPDLATLAAHMRVFHNARSNGVLDVVGSLEDRNDLETRYSYATVGPLLEKTLREIL